MPKSRPRPPRPDRRRSIRGSFSWIDHRFLREGFDRRLTRLEKLLYFVLLAVSNSRPLWPMDSGDIDDHHDGVVGLGTSVGSEIRRPLGVAIVGSLILSQMLTLFTTPVVYIYMGRFQSFLKRAFHRGAVPGHAPAHSD